MNRPSACVACRGPLEPDDEAGLCAGCLRRGLVADLLDGPAESGGGADLGDYELLSEIARGGMGVVFRARSRRLKRIVALKLVHVSPAVGSSLRRRFLYEAEVAAGLDHPNIVPVYEFGESDGRPWFSMKLLEGGSLEEHIGRFSLAEGTPNPERCRRAASLMATVARAVQHAHDRGVLHRDLKPSNILLDAQGTPHVTDFGLAKRLDGVGSHTLPEAVLGTPAYMAPEVARSGASAAGVRSDVYSLGSVMHHLLSGRPPFSGHSTLDLIRQVADSTAPSASRLGRQVDRDLGLICAKCLEHSESRRYATPGELADDLDRYLRGEPVEARPVTSAERVFLWARRHPGMATLSAVLLLALVVGGSGILWQWRRAERSATAALAAEHRTAENAYFAILEQARSAREQGDIASASQLLEGLDPSRRGFEWRLLQGFCRGDDLGRFAVPDGEPQVMDWVPARNRLAVVSAGRRLRWFDPAQGTFEEGPTIPDDGGRHARIVIDRGLHTLRFSPDGRHFLCGDGDVLLVVEAATGRLVHSGAGRHMGGVWLDSSRLLYGGNFLFGSGRGDPTVVLDVVTGEARRIPGERFGPFALSPDGRRLAWIRPVGETEEIEVVGVERLFEPDPRGPRYGVTPTTPGWMGFARDGRHLVVTGGRQTGSQDEVVLLDMDANAVRFSQRFPLSIRSVVLHPTQPELAIAADDAVLRVLRYLPPPAGPTATNGGTAVFDDDAVPEASEPVGPGGAAFPPRRFLSRSAGDGRFQFLLGHRGRLRDVAPNGSAEGWWTAGTDGTVARWPRASSAPRSRIAGVETRTFWEHPAASPDGRYLVYRDSTNRTRWLDRETGDAAVSAEGVYPLVVLRDGRVITRHFQSGIIACWPAREGGVGAPKPAWSFVGPASYPGFGFVVRAFATPDERRVVVLMPGQLVLVDLERRTAVATADQRMLYGASGVNCMDLSPDGSTIAVTGFIGRKARLYRTDDLNGGFRALGEPEDYDTAVAFHPDGRRVFVGNEDGRVRVFDVATGAELPGEGWSAQTGAVTAIATSADGRLVATSGDRTLRFWDAHSDPSHAGRRLRLQMQVPTPRNWMRFANEDRLFLHVAPGQPLEAWDAR